MNRLRGEVAKQLRIDFGKPSKNNKVCRANLVDDVFGFQDGIGSCEEWAQDVLMLPKLCRELLLKRSRLALDGARNWQVNRIASTKTPFASPRENFPTTLL